MLDIFNEFPLLVSVDWSFFPSTHGVLLAFPSPCFIRAGLFHALHNQTQQRQQQLWNSHPAGSPCAIQVFIPDQEQEKMEEHFLCTSPGLSKLLLCLPALATFMTGIFRWCQRDTKATNCSGKKNFKKLSMNGNEVHKGKTNSCTSP